MKREILFRGKDSVGNWRYGNLIVTKLIDTNEVERVGYAISGISSHLYCSGIQEETIGQFAGLLDKNRVRIFDGDILRSFDSQGLEIIHKVVFEDAGFRIKSLQVMEKFNDCGRIKQQWVNEFEKEVIGNIYDNPELLKNK